MHAHSSSCSHGHGGHTHHAPKNFNRAFQWAIAINFLYVILQVVFAIRSNSNSLFADAAHNLGDVLGLVFAFFSSLLHEKSATKKYSYGFKKSTILAAMINALILVFTCGFIGYDSILKFIHPDPIAAVDVMIVAGCGIVLNGASALFFMKGQHDINIRGTFLHLAYDALISVTVVIGAVVIYWTHWLWLDPLLGVLIIIVVLTGTFSLLKHSLRLVMDGVPPGLDVEEIKLFLTQKNDVVDVHDLHIWALSTKENILTAHVLVKPGKSMDEYTRDLTASIEKEFKIHHITLQLEESHCEKSC
jgi:cobalt-zinc-cadmium efflux system protein